AFSPDGHTMAFIRVIDVRPELYLQPVSDALQAVEHAKRITLENLGSSVKFPNDPVWTEDGSDIVVSSDQGLWRIGISRFAARAAESERLPFGEDACCPAISLRSHRLAYLHHNSPNYSIWRLAVPRGLSARNLTTAGSFNRSFIASTRHDFSPQLSLDGKRIAFASERSGNMEIWVCNSDGSSPVQLTFFHGPMVTTPRWSPDGRRIAFDSDAKGEFDIWVVGADGGE